MNIDKIKILSFLILAGTLIFSCEEDDSIARKGKPSITVTNKTVTVTEGETATFNLVVDYATINPISIRIDVLDESGNPIVVVEPSDGDSNSGNGYSPIEIEDIFVPYNTWFDSGYFSYGYQGGSGYIAVFDSGQTNLDINIETIEDILPNDTKTVQLRLTSTNLLEATIDEVVTINIENLIGEDLITRLDWAGDYLDNGVVACDGFDGLDLDLELYFNGGFADFSYNDCPEEIIIFNTYPDGSYEIDASFWTNNGFTSSSVTNVPVKIIFAKSGVFYQEVDLSSLFPLANGGLLDGNGSAITTFFINKTGNIYTVTDSNNSQIVQGRTKNNRITIEEKKKLKK
ncbi:hypothetical protein [Olleya sp. YS]|uniref:hypothetical protein n=1 Tax=Olleya sp. YS TaxID=3028318 RepID=UPI0024342285|nr:hypothetical protein [Olleya sp. YS]WGD33766.1 hypothetical protein Ollyesu_08235 [Olleya sp. YS]